MRFEDLGGRFKFATVPSSPLSLTSGNAAQGFVELSLTIVRESRGPMRLWDFARRLEHRLGLPRIPTGALCDAVKDALMQIDDPRIAVLATSMPGVGYI